MTDRQLIEKYNEYRGENLYEVYYPMDELEEFITSVPELIKAIQKGLNLNDDYFYYHDYGYIASVDEYELKWQAEDDTDFQRWLEEQEQVQK